MENENNNQKSVSHEPQAYSPSTNQKKQPQGAKPKLSNPLDMVKEKIMPFLSKIKLPKPNASTKPPQKQQSSESPPQQTAEVKTENVVASKSPSSKINTGLIKKIIIVVVILTLLLIGLALAMMYLQTNNGGVVPTELPSPTPSPTQASQNRRPSPYADDPEIAEIEKELDALEEKLNSAEFREDEIRLPQLNWNVNFEN